MARRRRGIEKRKVVGYIVLVIKMLIIFTNKTTANNIEKAMKKEKNTIKLQNLPNDLSI